MSPPSAKSKVAVVDTFPGIDQVLQQKKLSHFLFGFAFLVHRNATILHYTFHKRI